MTSNPAQNDAGPSNPAPNDAGPSNPAPNDAGTFIPVRNSAGTSYFALTEGLSQETLDEYQRFFREPQNADFKLYFYFSYLSDVVPLGITIDPFPPPPLRISRDELRLRTPSGKIFMSGLVAMEMSHDDVIEPASAAAAVAGVEWGSGHFVPDGNKHRFFIGIGPALIRFYKSLGATRLSEDSAFTMMTNARGVAIYLQQEYDSLPLASRF